MFLTSRLDLLSGYNLRGGLDAAGEDRLGVIEAGYSNPGNPVALIRHRAAGNRARAKTPLNLNSLSNDQRAVLSDDTGGSDR